MANDKIQELIDFLQSFENDPYPEDVFLPIPTNVLEMIHSTLMDEYKIPLDRLTGHIGRILRKPLADKAKELLRSLPSTESRESDAVEFSNEEILKLISEELEREYSENEACEMLSTARVEISSKYAKVTYSNGKQDLWKIKSKAVLLLQLKTKTDNR